MTELETFSPYAYWDKHELHRQSVDELVDEFVGWKPLCELIDDVTGNNKETEQRNKVFISTMFQTGGRVSEVLQLRFGHISPNYEDKVIRINFMPLLKRYKKIKTKIKEDGSHGWITERLVKQRKPFPIDMREPLTYFLII